MWQKLVGCAVRTDTALSFVSQRFHLPCVQFLSPIPATCKFLYFRTWTNVGE